MSHPLIPSLQSLAALLESHPALATTREAVIALDKVAASAAAAIALIESAAAGSTPEAQQMRHWLGRVSAKASDEKAIKTKLTGLLGKLPPASKKLSPQENLGRIAEIAVRQGKAAAALALIQQHLNRPTFTATGDRYELLKEIRRLGQMDLSERKAAKTWLLSNPDKVRELCEAAGIPTTTGAVRKPVSTTSLVTKLMQHGERYAENAGD